MENFCNGKSANVGRNEVLGNDEQSDFYAEGIERKPYKGKEPILDKIRAEVKALNPEPTAYDVVDGNPIKDAVWKALADVLKIIDKYKAETEGEE